MAIEPAPAKAGVVNAAALADMRQRALAALVIARLAEHPERLQHPPSHQAEDRASEQGFFDQRNADGCQKYWWQQMPWKRVLQFPDVEPEETGAQSGHGARGNHKAAEQVGYSPRVFAQTKILESLRSDPSQERDQKQKGGN